MKTRVVMTYDVPKGEYLFAVQCWVPDRNIYDPWLVHPRKEGESRYAMAMRGGMRTEPAHWDFYAPWQITLWLPDEAKVRRMARDLSAGKPTELPEPVVEFVDGVEFTPVEERR